MQATRFTGGPGCSFCPLNSAKITGGVNDNNVEAKQFEQKDLSCAMDQHSDGIAAESRKIAKSGHFQ